MNKKLQTPLHHFKFGARPAGISLDIEWYYFNLNEDVEDERGFTDEELKIFQNYVVQNETNFGGLKNYFSTDEYDVPVIVSDDLVPSDRIQFPGYLILKPNPQLQRTGISSAMEIVLLDINGKEKHDYNLSFGAIGKVKGRIK